MKIELLSPAGTYESLKAAINAGADAVYLGGTRFGARAYAGNLSDEELLKAIDYVHIHGKRLYLTLNTLLKNKEIDNELYDYLRPLYEQGLDAVIVQDLGIVSFVKSYFPNLPIHASTQMSVMGVYGVKVLEDLGISRVVTARELSLAEIGEIKENSSIEIEDFVHGALCYGYSGMCLLSSMLGGRSGNRGRCAQPCRLPYDVLRKGKAVNKGDEQYVLSPRDICTIEILPEIIKAGVTSLKIEGRMKSVEYTAGVTSIYRKYIDKFIRYGSENYTVEKEDLNNLLELYSRSGKSTGYYKQHNGRNMITLNKPGYISKTSEFSVPDRKKQLNCCIDILKDKLVQIKVSDKLLSVTMNGNIPSGSVNKPLTDEVVRKQINKTGGSEYCFDKIEINLDDGLFLPIQELNSLRREALDKFTLNFLKKYKRKVENIYVNDTEKQQFDVSLLKVSCYVENPGQFDAVCKVKNVSEIYINYSCIDLAAIDKFVNQAHQNDKKLFLSLPFIFRSAAAAFFDKYINILQKSELDGYVIKNIDELGYFREKDSRLFIFDYHMYALNNQAKRMLDYWNPYRITLPLELNYKELKEMECNSGEMIVYGYLPLMISAGCIRKTLNNCSKNEEVLYLKDRYNKKFMVKNSCDLCYNTIYNSEPVSLLGVSDNVKSLNPGAVRLNFTEEKPEETVEILNEFIDVFIKEKSDFNEINSFTRGHFKRGIE